jgi:osmotically-inducible protein OsmY
MSYDDIARKTVAEPDSSVRPSRAQEQAAREEFRALDQDESTLQDNVLRALADAGPALARVTVEVSRDLVILRGQVDDPAMLRTAEDIVATVHGVETVHNQVVVAAASRP